MMVFCSLETITNLVKTEKQGNVQSQFMNCLALSTNIFMKSFAR